MNGQGLSDSEVYWLNEEIRLRKRVFELQDELRRTKLALQEATERYKNPRPERETDPLLASEPWNVLEMGQGRGARCRLCGWAIDEVGGSSLFLGVCEMCRGAYGQEFARPRALIEAILEEPHQEILIEFAAADEWSRALGRPIGIGTRVDAIGFLKEKNF